MDIKKIEDYIPEHDPIKYPISICFTRSEVERWNKVKLDLKSINKRAKLSEFARRKLTDMLDALEKLVEEKKKSSP